jgi:hypothetical protein
MAKDVPAYKKRARKSAEKRKEKPGITLREGPNCLRVGPTPAGKTSPDTYMEYAVHENVGPNKKYLRCGHPPGWKKGDDDTEDWLCDVYVAKLRKKGKATRAEANAPKPRLVVQASEVKEDDDGNTKFGDFKPWHPSGKTAGSLLTSILGSKTRDYIDPKKGYNINIERTGSGFKDTRYGSIEPDDEPSRVPSALIEALKPFDQVRGIPTYNAKAQKAAIAGQDFDWKADAEDTNSESETDSEETESGVDDVFDSESASSEKSKKRKKDKMAVTKRASKGKDTKSKKTEEESEEEDSEEQSSEESSEEASSEESSEEESKDKKKSKKDKKKKKESEEDSSEESSEEDSEEDSTEESSEESEEEDSEEESEEKPKKKPAKKAAAKKATKKKK